MWRPISRNPLYSVNMEGVIKTNATGKIKRPTLNKKTGYLVVDLYKDNKRTKVPVHRIVAETFIPNPGNKPTVDHIDGNRINNSVTNLRWATYSEQNSRFNSAGVRSEKVLVKQYAETRNPRGGGHIEWQGVTNTLFFSSISEAARYFQCSISNISLLLKEGTIGRRGKTRGYQFLYYEGKRVTL